jgi:spore germination protein YaaH
VLQTNAFSNTSSNTTNKNSNTADLGSANKNDTNPPHIPQGFSVKALDNTLELNWKQNVKEDEVDKYLINLRTSVEKQDSDPVAVNPDVTSYQIKDLTNAFYFVSIEAIDRSGNKSKATKEIGIAPNSSENSGFEVIGWMPLIDVPDQKNTVNNNFEVFTSLSPFIYSLEPDGTIKKHGDVLDDDLINKLNDSGKKNIPTITNNFDDNSKGTNVVMDWRKRKKNIEMIISEVKENNYDGIDIDYENLDNKAREDFSQYIKVLAKELHQINKILSVTLQAKQSDDESWTQAYDFEELGKNADQIRIMTYDHARANTQPGPIAPIKWMVRALTYAQSKVDSTKIIAGLPFYAYDWCTEGMCENRGLVYDGVKNILDENNIEIEWDDDAKCPWFYYTDDKDNPHTVYFENERSITEKINVIKKLGIAGVAIWRLGNEDQGNFTPLKNIKRLEVDSVYNINVEPKDSEINLSWEAPINKDFKGYKVLFKKQGGEQRFLSVFGKTEMLIPNLENNEEYYITILPLTWDALINDDVDEENLEPQVVATPNDYSFPNTIKDLKALNPTDTTINLEWTASGDDYDQGLANYYDIRYSENLIDEDSFYSATQYKLYPEPLIPPSLQEIQLKSLTPGTKYYFAIKAVDEEKNPSLISNAVSTNTIDTIPPKIPSEPIILSSDAKIEISWTKNSEKDLAFYKLYYKQEKSFYNAIEIKPEKNVYILENLENNYKYFVSISAVDLSGNESARTKEIEVMPKANSLWQRLNDNFNKSHEKIKAASMIFGKRLISTEAVPYLVMFSIVIINIFIFSGLKKEIHKKVKETVKKEQNVVKPNPAKDVNDRADVIDLRQKK